MKKITLLFIGCCFGFISLNAQLWDGGGDGHSWNDAMNWDNDLVPGATDLVEINSNVTIDGTASSGIGRLKIGGGNKTVILDLDLTIGNGVVAEHGIVIGNKTSLIIGTNSSNRTVTVNVPNDKDAVAIFNNVSDATDIAELIIETGNTLNIAAGDDAMNLASINGAFAFINNGTLTIAGVDNIAFNQQDGTIINNGTITINAAIANRGIRYEVEADSLVNNGTITIFDAIDDAIVLSGTDFINNGTLNFTVVATATASNNGLVIETGGEFTNNGTINANGGTSANGRSIVVNDGVLNNTGTITITGGNVGTAFRLDGGITTNMACGKIDGQGGTRINANGGAFINNGLLKSSHTGSGIFLGSASTATVTNNAFFAYDNSNQFATGTGGSIIDNGANVGTDTLSVDALLSCTIADLSIDVIYDLYSDVANTNLVGTTDAVGAVTFGIGTFSAGGTQNLYTCYGSEFMIEVLNVSGDCATVIPAPDSVNITFKVNTNKVGLNVDPAGIFLAGGGNFGVPGDNPMTDADNDGIFEITVRKPKGFGSFYTFTNGNCPNYSCKEDISGQACAAANNFNDRTLPGVYSDTTLSTCFGECEGDGSCPINTNRLINDESLFSIAPTLVHDFTIITFGTSIINTQKTIRLFNAVGQNVLNTTVENTDKYRLNTNDLPSGLYFINIQTDGKMATKRLMIAK